MYRAMSARILEELKKIYSDDDLNVTIFGFEAGSVIVKFRWLENERGGFICKFTFRRHTGSSKLKGAKLGEGSFVRANLLCIGWPFCQQNCGGNFIQGDKFFARACTYTNFSTQAHACMSHGCKFIPLVSSKLALDGTD